MSGIQSINFVGFEAVVPGGALRLVLPSSAACSDAVGAALLLASAEPLVAELERWLGAPLDPAPAPQVDLHLPSGLLAMVSDDALAPVGTELHLPLPLMFRAPAMPAAMRGESLVWQSMAFELELARYAQSPVPRDGAESGGVLLLPGSFEPHWAVRLVSRAIGLAIDARWAGPGHALRIESPARPLDETPPAWRVLLSRTIDLDPVQAFGATPHAPLHLAVHGSEPCAARLVSPDGSALPFAAGHVVTALQGAALWMPAADAAPADPRGTARHDAITA